MKVGQKYRVQCYKHNGKVYQSSDDTYILDIKDDYIVCGNYMVNITDANGQNYKTKELAILFFYKRSWFNCIAQLKKTGLYYYCNIATPYIIDEDVIKYIDYDLDLRVYPSGNYKVLDNNEYNYHKRKMRYSDEIDIIVNKELEKLIEKVQKKEIPFNKEIINYYKNKYFLLINNSNKPQKIA